MRLQFDYDGGGPAKGGLATLFVNGEKVAGAPSRRHNPGIFSTDERRPMSASTWSTPVVEGHRRGEAKSRFSGRIQD